MPPATSRDHDSAIGARATNSGNVAIGSSAWTAITFDTNDWDTGGIHSTSVNTSRFTIPRAGKYVISGTYVIAASTTGSRYIAIAVNGTRKLNVPQKPDKSADGTNDGHTLSDILNLNAGDYVELMVFQDSGGSLNVIANGAYCAVAFVGT